MLPEKMKWQLTLPAVALPRATGSGLVLPFPVFPGTLLYTERAGGHAEC